MNFNLLTTVLTTFVKALSQAQGSISKVGPFMNGLAAIEIVLSVMWWALDGATPSEPFKKVLQITFWLWFATNFPGLAHTFMTSLVHIALGAGGQAGNEAILLDPSQFAGLALDATFPLVQSIQDAGITHIADIFLVGTAYLVLLASYFLIACHAALAVIEYYLVVTLAACLIPFGISQHTRFLAEKAIGATVAVSVKMMVVSFIISIIKPTITSFHFTSGGSTEILLNEALSMCLVCIMIAIVVWRAPALASDLLAASPSLSAGHVGQHASSAMTTVSTSSAAKFLGSKGAAATRAAARLVGGGAAAGFTRLGSALGGGRGNAAGANGATAASTAVPPGGPSSPRGGASSANKTRV